MKRKDIEVEKGKKMTKPNSSGNSITIQKTGVSGFPKAQKMAHGVPAPLQVTEQLAGESREGTSAEQMHRACAHTGLAGKALPAGVKSSRGLMASSVSL